MSPTATNEDSRHRAARDRGERTREAILDVTERLLVEKADQDAVSIREIATTVGVTPPSIYRYFDDKDALLLAVCARHFARLDAQSEAAAASVEDPSESLRQRGLAYVRYGIENPGIYRILFMGGIQADHDFDVERMPGSEAFLHLLEAVERCIDARTFRSTDSFTVAAGLWTVVHGVTSLLISHPYFPWPENLAEQVFDAHLRGLAA